MTSVPTINDTVKRWMPRDTRFRFSLFMGLLSIELLAFKLHKLYRLQPNYSLTLAFQVIRWDLIFLVSLGLFSLLVLKQNKFFRWMGEGFLLVFGTFGLLILTMEHAFFLKTGTVGGWYLCKYTLTHFNHVWTILHSELNKPGSLLFFVPIAFYLIPLLLEWVPAIERRLMQPETPTPSWRWERRLFVSIFILALSPPWTPPPSHLYALVYNAVFRLVRESTEDMLLPKQVSMSSIRKEKLLFDTHQLQFKTTPQTHKKNVVMILLESTGSRSITPYNSKRTTTPFLAKLAKKSLLVEKMYAVIPHTSKALVSILCGIYPKITMHVAEGDAGGIPGRCLPQLLGSLGYQTAFFQTATLRFEQRAQMARNMGYDWIRGLEDFNTKGFAKANYLGQEDRLMFKPSLKWLDQTLAQKRPFLLTYLTLVSHHTYTTPPGFKKKKYTDSNDPDYNNYLNTLRYIDDFVADLFREFRKRGLFKNTLFVLVGDHGEAFGEHLRRQHDNVIWEEGLRIPMLLYSPSLFPKGKRVTGLRQQIDILPTIADALNIHVKGGRLPGASILKPAAPKRTLFFSCWYEQQCMASQQQQSKSIYHYRFRPLEFYNLMQDPFERKGVSGWLSKYKEKRRKTENQLLRWKERVNWVYEQASRERIRQAVSQEEPQVSLLADITFGPYVRLVGATLQQKQLYPGGVLDITYVFQALRKIPKSWQLFFHIGFKLPPQDSKSSKKNKPTKEEKLNVDHTPVGGAYPVHRWKTHEFVKDNQHIKIPAKYPPGTQVTVYLGMWSKDKGRTKLHKGSRPMRTDNDRRLILFQETLKAP